MVGSGVGILKWCIHTLLTLTRGHSTTVRDVTGNPCERSIWSLYSLYSLDALTLTPSSRSTGTACDRLENMYTVPSITTRQCALPSPRRLLIYTPRPYLLRRLPVEIVAHALARVPEHAHAKRALLVLSTKGQGTHDVPAVTVVVLAVHVGQNLTPAGHGDCHRLKEIARAQCVCKAPWATTLSPSHASITRYSWSALYMLTISRAMY